MCRKECCPTYPENRCLHILPFLKILTADLGVFDFLGGAIAPYINTTRQDSKTTVRRTSIFLKCV